MAKEYCDICLEEKGENHKCSICKICGRDLEGEYKCKCMGIQTYAMSNYPGEYKLVRSHPDNPDQHWYKREDVDAIIIELKKELAQYKNY